MKFHLDNYCFICFNNIKSSKNFGLDVETWAKEGLIDSVAQGIMTHYEDLTGCLDKEGLIDVGKYAEEIKKRSVVKRYFGHDADKNYKCIVEGSKELKGICDKYGKDYFGTLGWESIPEDMNIDLANEQRKAGVTKFISWNGNHKAKRLKLLAAEKYISRSLTDTDVKRPEFVRCFRVLTLGGEDISSFSPNRRG